MSMMQKSNPDACAIASRFIEVRKFTEHIVEPLQVEDWVIQAASDVSPVKWPSGSYDMVL